MSDPIVFEMNIGLPADRVERAAFMNIVFNHLNKSDAVTAFDFRLDRSQYTNDAGVEFDEEVMVVAVGYLLPDPVLEVAGLCSTLGEECIAVFYPDEDRGELIGPYDFATKRVDLEPNGWSFDEAQFKFYLGKKPSPEQGVYGETLQ